MFGRKQPTLFKKILAVVDNSDVSMHAAEFAIKLASELEAQLFAVTVVDTETLNRLTKMRLFVEEEKEEFELDLERTASKNLSYIKQQGDSQKVDVKTFLLRGCIHKMVLNKAHEIKADLIVLGGWKMSVIKRDLLVRERQLILDEAESFVMVVKEESIL